MESLSSKNVFKILIFILPNLILFDQVEFKIDVFGNKLVKNHQKFNFFTTDR